MLFFMHIMINIPRLSPQRVFRIAGNTVLAFALTMIAAPIVQIVMYVSDQLTSGLAQIGGNAAGSTLDSVMSSLTGISVAGGVPGLPIVMTVLMLIAMFIVGIVLLILMVIRSVILYLAVLAIPFTTPSVVDGKKRLAKAHAGLVFGIIIAEPIVVAVFAFGGILLQNGFQNGGGLYAIIAGFGLLLAATVAPLTLLKALVPGHAAHVVAHVQSGAKRAKSSLSSMQSRGRDFATKVAAPATGGVSLLASSAATRGSSHTGTQSRGTSSSGAPTPLPIRSTPPPVATPSSPAPPAPSAGRPTPPPPTSPPKGGKP